MARRRRKTKRDGGFAQFDSQLKDFSADLDDKAQVFRNAVAIWFLTKVVDISPVDTGHFKNNWRVAINQPQLAVLAGVDKTGDSTVARGTSTIEKARMGDDIWINNNVSYALYLEFGTEFMEPRRPLGQTIELLDSWSEGQAA